MFPHGQQTETVFLKRPRFYLLLSAAFNSIRIYPGGTHFDVIKGSWRTIEIWYCAAGLETLLLVKMQSSCSKRPQYFGDGMIPSPKNSIRWSVASQRTEDKLGVLQRAEPEK